MLPFRLFVDQDFGYPLRSHLRVRPSFVSTLAEREPDAPLARRRRSGRLGRAAAEAEKVGDQVL